MTEMLPEDADISGVPDDLDQNVALDLEEE